MILQGSIRREELTSSPSTFGMKTRKSGKHTHAWQVEAVFHDKIYSYKPRLEPKATCKPQRVHVWEISWESQQVRLT